MARKGQRPSTHWSLFSEHSTSTTVRLPQPATPIVYLARSGPVLAITQGGSQPLDVEAVFEVPKLAPEIDPILMNLPLQLLAYHVALGRGRDVDQPRNLAKSVTVE